jgi:hypothetical protein
MGTRAAMADELSIGIADLSDTQDKRGSRDGLPLRLPRVLLAAYFLAGVVR